MLKVLYFASVREALGKDAEAVEVPTPATVAGLVERLRSRAGPYAEALASHRRWRVAVNQEMVGLSEPLKAGDEVAIFPPVTGG
jgi:molybdopterin synthase sulfur carrier subunit